MRSCTVRARAFWARRPICSLDRLREAGHTAPVIAVRCVRPLQSQGKLNGFLVSLEAASAGAGQRSDPPVNSTSMNPAYTLSDGFLAVSFDNLGAGAHLALSIAEASHRT